MHNTIIIGKETLLPNRSTTGRADEKAKVLKRELVDSFVRQRAEAGSVYQAHSDLERQDQEDVNEYQT